MDTVIRLGLVAAVAAAALAASLFFGGVALGANDIVSALLHPRHGGEVVTIVWSLRMPRACIAAFVGASLAVSGYLLQGMLRNPLVDPFLTGVSAGSAAAVAIAVALGAAGATLPAFGFLAGLGTALTVAALARRGAGLDAERLILAGVSLSALFSAIVALVLTRLGRGSAETILAWLAGSLAARGYPELLWALPYGSVGLAVAVACVPALNALRLGGRMAGAVGVDVARLEWWLLASATLLTASAVSLSGIVGFVGLIVPHLARRLVGTDGRLALPASALLGVALVAGADTVARTLMPPTEIPLGVLLAFIGVPVFLYLYLRPQGATRLWGT
ncbi:MAG: iron ABC transporter permease [Candidatus Eremiobacteraeota bacterium]|nr:iron ABC transporter permease [Candidatus Eremiobacteraeota bacterium]